MAHTSKLRIRTVDPRTIPGDLDPWTQVRVVLAQSKAAGLPFDGPEGEASNEGAWFTSMRAISPPRTCSVAVRAEIEDSRQIIHEAKPFFRAAYEGREVTAEEVDFSSAQAAKRLDEAWADALIAA